MLAAIAHAAGSHEHREITYDLDGPSISAAAGGHLPSLHSWPTR